MASSDSEKCGSHDMQVSLSQGKDFPQFRSDCQRNPQHKNFKKMKDLSIRCLPTACQNQDLLDYIKAFSDLTVRLVATKTSKDRPKTFPRTDKPYPAYECIGTDHIRAGSGWIRSVQIFSEDSKETCPCAQCDYFGNARRVWGRVEISTAKHLVFNTEEAKSTQADLFYDEDDLDLASSGTRLWGYKVYYSNIKEDKCWMYYVTHDIDLCERLRKTIARRQELADQLHIQFKDSPEAELTVIASHPHGCSKRVCIGEWTAHKLTIDSPWWARATYNKITCPGSSGSPVWSLGRKEVEAWRIL